MSEKIYVQKLETYPTVQRTHQAVTQAKEVAKGGRCQGVGRPPGSSKPRLASAQVHLGWRSDPILYKSVADVSMWEDGGNRSQEL